MVFEGVETNVLVDISDTRGLVVAVKTQPLPTSVYNKGFGGLNINESTSIIQVRME
jgi:hypothetical protein